MFYCNNQIEVWNVVQNAWQLEILNDLPTGD